MATLNVGGLAGVQSISCSSSGNCAAVGFYTSATEETAFVATETSGVWGNAEPVPGLAAAGTGGPSQAETVSCAAAVSGVSKRRPGCSAGGWFSQHGPQAFVVSESGGTWGNAVPVPGISTLNTHHSAETVSVSCASAGKCTAAGNYAPRGTGEISTLFVTTRS